jgi:polar amino acid transport system substrate-binding protein
MQFAKTNTSMRVLDKGLTVELYGYALRKDDPLIAQMNKALAQLRADGTYNTLVNRWFAASK